MSSLSLPRPSSWRSVARLLLVLATTAGGASAQAPRTITGVIRDSSGVGIAGAEVTVVGTTMRAESEADGAFRLANVAAGPATSLHVRRLGFRATDVDAPAAAGSAPVIITLVRAAQELPAVLVSGQRSRALDMRLGGFYQRRKGGAGRFITRDQIEQIDPMMMTDVFRRIPGAQIMQGSGGIRNAVRFRGQRCAPLVFLDGMALAAAEFDLDALVPASIEAMEIYSGPAGLPAQFMAPPYVQACGTIVIWSRSGEPRPHKQGDRTAASMIADLVESAKVYTADQVDVPAHADSTSPVQPIYPDSLYIAHVGGTVVAEFVVDTDGDVSLDEFSVVSSTHPLFSEAVRRVMGDAKFIPAQRQGRRVRQVVQWPFRFVPAGGSTP